MSRLRAANFATGPFIQQLLMSALKLDALLAKLQEVFFHELLSNLAEIGPRNPSFWIVFEPELDALPILAGKFLR